MKYYELTAHEAAELIKKKDVSSVELTKSFLERIESMDKKVNAFIEVTGDAALKKATSVDKKIAGGEKVCALAGVPMAVKDNLCTKGIKTTCASKMLYNYVPPFNATAVQKLEAADCVMLGKTNMDEFAMGSSTENSAYKKTSNPYDLERVPGGSSGGSAAAVAADEAIFTLGSDTGGSIRQPAALCGTVGFKPTYGMVSRFGLVAFASSLDQIGPLTKDVTDCALVMDTICGHDEKDSTSLPFEKPDFVGALNMDVKGMRIGMPREYMGDAIDAEVKNAVLNAAKQYEKLGAEIVQCSLPTMPYALAAYYLISSAEASSNLARYDGVRYGFRAEKSETLEELFLNTRSEGFGKEVKRRIMLGTFVLSSGYYDAYYKKAQKVRTLIKNDFENAMKDVDFLISPTSPTTAWKMGEKTDDPLKMYAADICTVSLNIAGLPGLVLPCGYGERGLPIGLQLIGKPCEDAKLITGGHALEKSGFVSKIKPTIGGNK